MTNYERLKSIEKDFFMDFFCHLFTCSLCPFCECRSEDDLDCRFEEWLDHEENDENFLQTFQNDLRLDLYCDGDKSD